MIFPQMIGVPGHLYYAVAACAAETTSPGHRSSDDIVYMRIFCVSGMYLTFRSGLPCVDEQRKESKDNCLKHGKVRGECADSVFGVSPSAIFSSGPDTHKNISVTNVERG